MSVLPLKADSVLLVDANAVLPFPVALQQFQAVARRHSEFGNLSNAVELIQLPAGNRPD
jgi:hypothetical protein